MNVLNFGSKPDDFKFDHMLYMRLFEGCNVFCEHCFIPNNPKKMNLSNPNLSDFSRLKKSFIQSLAFIEFLYETPCSIEEVFIKLKKGLLFI